MLGPFPFFSRAKRRIGDDILMCDGKGPLWRIIGETNGDTDCWQENGRWHCQIRFFNDSVFAPGNDFCRTMLHEILHAGNWPQTDSKADRNSAALNAAGFLYDYLCASERLCRFPLPSDFWQTVGPFIR